MHSTALFQKRKLLLVMTTNPAEGGMSSHRTSSKIIILAMKLTSIILLTTCLTAAAAGHSQGVTLNIKDAPLEKVFNEIRKQTGYNFLFSSKELKKAGKVTVQVSNASIEQILALCFKDKPFTYTIDGNSIVVKKKEEPKLTIDNAPLTDLPLPIDITGKVTDEDGNPLSGANVKVKGTNKGTTTGNDGVFVLKGVDEKAVLEISYVGYETYTVSLSSAGGGIRKADGGGLTIVASLKVKPESLNEVIINKGYYTEKQKYSVGNVTKITSKDIERQPVDNPLLALKGLVPGLQITQANGIPGGGVTVRIQGQNSIRGGSDPLIVVDGVPYPSQMLPTTSVGTILGQSGASFYSPGGNGNPLSYINTLDIESIEVLKDADATSIYGSRAANGAILITTKTGKVGPTKVDINLQQGWGKITRSLDMMNTQQYVQMRKEAFANDNVVVTPTDRNYDINGLWDQNRYTDWVKTLIGGTAKYNNINGSVSGGSSNIQYLVGATYHRETTVFPGDFNDQKGDVHFSINSTSANRKFQVGLTGSYLMDNNQLPENDYTASAYTLPPDAPALYNPDGTLNWAPNLVGNSSWNNPLALQYKIYQNKTDNLISSANLSYTIFKGFEISSRFGYSQLTTDEFSTELTPSQKPETRANYVRGAYYSNSVIKTINIEPQLNYTRTIKNGTLDFLVGSTIQQQNSDGQILSGSGFLTDALRDLRSASSFSPNSSVNATYKYNAAFGRLNYNLKNKYIINLTARRDGSSHFGPENRFHNFASAGGAWIFSEENFIQRNLKFLSFGKLKASYGTTGNDQIGDYLFLERYISINGAVPYQGGSSIITDRITNPSLQWEETHKLSVGLELAFINDRIALSATYGRNRSSNELLSYALPITTGFGRIDRNFPATIQNTTWEFSVNSSNIQGRTFEWTSSFNLTIPKNKLIAFPNIENSNYAGRLFLGQPLSITIPNILIGVDPATGVYQFVAKNGGTTTNPSVINDPVKLINVDPKFYGGFQNTIRYKHFELEVLFQFIKQTQKDAYRFGIGTLPPGMSMANQPVSVLNRWQKPGDKSSVQLYSENFSKAYNPYRAANTSDAAYVNASYIRFQNMSISYDLNKVLQKIQVKRCNVFLSGQNLFTITGFKGVDPENHSNVSLAPLKIYTAGIQLGF